MPPKRSCLSSKEFLGDLCIPPFSPRSYLPQHKVFSLKCERPFLSLFLLPELKRSSSNKEPSSTFLHIMVCCAWKSAHSSFLGKNVPVSHASNQLGWKGWFQGHAWCYKRGQGKYCNPLFWLQNWVASPRAGRRGIWDRITSQGNLYSAAGKFGRMPFPREAEIRGRGGRGRQPKEVG